jgi:hypothetical protein
MLPQLSKEIYKQSTLSFGSFLVFSQLHVTRIHFIYFNADKNFRLAIQRLEIAKNDLQNRIAKEVSEESAYVLIGLGLVASCSIIVSASQARGNAILQASLERRKQALHERRMALEQDVCPIPLPCQFYLAMLCYVFFRMKV